MAYADIVKESMDLDYYEIHNRHYDLWERSLFSVLGKAYQAFLPTIAAKHHGLSVGHFGPGRQASGIRDAWWGQVAPRLREVELYDIDERALTAGRQAFAALGGVPPALPIHTHLVDITCGLGETCNRIVDDAPPGEVVSRLNTEIVTDRQPAPRMTGQAVDVAVSEMVLGATGMAVFARAYERLTGTNDAPRRDDLLALRARFHGAVAHTHLRGLSEKVGPGGDCILATETSVVYLDGRTYPTFDPPLSTVFAESNFDVCAQVDGRWVDIPDGPGAHSHTVSVWLLTRRV